MSFHIAVYSVVNRNQFHVLSISYWYVYSRNYDKTRLIPRAGPSVAPQHSAATMRTWILLAAVARLGSALRLAPPSRGVLLTPALRRATWPQVRLDLALGEDESSLLPPWEAVQDDSGQTYYWNTVTDETSWERPVQAPPTQSVPATSSARVQGRETTLSSSNPMSEGDGTLLGGMISRQDNPYETSKADRLRAKFGEGVVMGSSAPREIVEDQLAADLARFKSDRNILPGDREAAEEELTLVGKTVNVLGTVLTYNFFIICALFLWFLAGVGMQYGAQNTFLIGAFQGCWDLFILPLLTTHMTLTFLSAGLEKLSSNDA